MNAGLDRDRISERLEEVFSLVFEVDPGFITSEISVATLGNWDSLRHLTLVLAVEEEFGVSFPLEEAITWQDFGSILTALEARLTKGKS